MNNATKKMVRERASGCCEYCRISAEFFLLPFQVEHIIAKKHHGSDDDANLAYACDRCNLHKGSNLSGIDQLTGELTRLFHPRTDVWNEHFLAVTTGEVEAVSAVGRVTVDVLNMNAPIRVELRAAIGVLRRETNQ
jgi:hypothetical protein